MNAGDAGRDQLSDDERLRVRIAWHYFIEGLTQADIAQRLSLNRVRVNRLLAQCREEGMVQITIASRLTACIAQERALEEQFGLTRAFVVPTPSDKGDVPRVIGAAAGSWLSSRLKDGLTVGIGWGRTLRHSLNAVRSRSVADITVVSLIGGLTRAAAMNAYETASHLAEVLGGECYYLAAPVYAGDEETRDILLAQSLLREVLERAAEVDLALISVGGMSSRSTIRQLGVLGEEEMQELRAAGAIGDILGHYIDAEGVVIDHPVNRRVVAMAPDRLYDLAEVAIASGGEDKLVGIRGALRARYARVLITDEATAARLLEEG